MRIIDISTRERFCYRAGARTEIWSNTDTLWHAGMVDMVAQDVVQAEEGLTLPKGSVKVAWGTKTKWVEPARFATLLRPIQ